MLPVPKFLTESRSNGTLGLQGVASQLMKADNKRYLNIGTEEDTHSIQNQDIEVTFPDSVENRSAANFRTIPNQKQVTKSIDKTNLKVESPPKSKLNNDLSQFKSPSKSSMSKAGVDQSILRNNHTEEALIYKTIDSRDTLKPTKISDFRQSLVTGASTTESKELPALH